MKRVLLIASLLFISLVPTYAAVIKVDSMYAVLKTEKEDTNKVCTLVSLAFQILYKGNYVVGDSLSQY